MYFDAGRQKWFTLEPDTSVTQSLSPFRRRPSVNVDGDNPASSTLRKKTKKGTSVSPSPFARGRGNTVHEAGKPDSPTRKNSPANSHNESFFNSKDYSSPNKGALAESNKEKKKRAFQQKKALLLKEFEINDPGKKLELTKKSPTTESMKNSIIAITYSRTGRSSDADSAKKMKKGMTTFFGEVSSRFQLPVDGKLQGHKPCARDGHSAFMLRDRMLIFGGDRHKMSFNDVYILSVDALISNVR